MEVHHHAHTSRKKWTHYLWEFLMLFLAVFCGFLAENFREHKVETNREKQFMRALVKDLKADTADLTQLIQLRNDRHLMYDSLSSAFTENSFSKNGSGVYYWGRSITRRQYFFSSDGTMQQLKNSGGLRLVSNKSIAEQIMAYDVLYRTILNQQGLEETQLEDYRNLASKVFDGAVFKKMSVFKKANDATGIFITERPSDNPPLRNTSQELLNDVVNKLNYWRAGSNYINFLLSEMKEKATLLIESIQEDYQLN